MIWSRKKPPPIRSLIGEGTVVRGEICFTDGLRIDGEVVGDVLAAGTGPSLLVVSENAKVQGRVKAGHVIINGKVNGPVESADLLELQPAARVIGDVRYQLLEMHPGAVIEGELRTSNHAVKPALKLAASQEG